MCCVCCRVKEALGGAKNPVRVLRLDPEAPARHIAFYSPFDSKECPFDSEHRPFLGAAISTESLLYYVVFKEDGSEPGEHRLHNPSLGFGNGSHGSRKQSPSSKTT